MTSWSIVAGDGKADPVPINGGFAHVDPGQARFTINRTCSGPAARTTR